MSPNLERYLLKATLQLPYSWHKSGTGVPVSVCLRMARISLSLNRDIFMQNFLVSYGKKFYF